MGDDRGEALTPVPEATEDKRPSGLPPAESTARRLEVEGAAEDARKERRDPTPVTRLRPPKSEPPAESVAEGVGGTGPDGDRPSQRPSRAGKPPGLKDMTTSARLRLQLALDEDDEDGEPVAKIAKRPAGLTDMTPSARLRLQLALDEDIDEMEAIRPPRLPSSASMMAVGYIPFDDDARRIVGSLSRWVAFCGLLTLAVGALTGLSYLTGPGSVAHVVVGILATALSVWLLAAAFSFRRVLTQKRQQHHLVNGLGLLRSALLLKAILLFSGMVLGCFTFSIATGLLFLL